MVYVGLIILSIQIVGQIADVTPAIFTETTLPARVFHT